MKMGNKLGIVLFCLASVAQASAGREGGNGGDMCEDRIKVIGDDIASWIHKGGPAKLNLPETTDAFEYSSSMLNSISKAKISCTSQTLKIGNAEKTCINYPDPANPRILCNSAKFMNTTEELQYVLVHHEYAGLANLEVNQGESSNYTISNQLSAYLEKQFVLKLAIHPSSPPLVPTEAYQTLNEGHIYVTADPIEWCGIQIVSINQSSSSIELRFVNNPMTGYECENNAWLHHLRCKNSQCWESSDHNASGLVISVDANSNFDIWQGYCTLNSAGIPSCPYYYYYKNYKFVVTDSTSNPKPTHFESGKSIACLKDEAADVIDSNKKSVKEKAEKEALLKCSQFSNKCAIDKSLGVSKVDSDQQVCEAWATAIAQ
jgi:hypothetical protein